MHALAAAAAAGLQHLQQLPPYNMHVLQPFSSGINAAGAHTAGSCRQRLHAAA
jgi:hypothetical protein